VTNLGLLAMTVAVAGALAALPQEPDSAPHGPQPPVRKLLVLPPEASVIRRGVKAAVPLMEQSRQLETAFQRVANSLLAAKGCTVLPDLLASASPGNDSDLKYAIADLEKSFDQLQAKISKKSKDVPRGRFTLGDEVSKVNPDGSADALLFIRGQGLLTTGGERTFDIMTGGVVGLLIAEDRLSLQAAVVDARTGTVIGYGKHGSTGNFLKSDGPAEKSMREALSHFFCAHPDESPAPSETPKP